MSLLAQRARFARRARCLEAIRTLDAALDEEPGIAKDGEVAEPFDQLVRKAIKAKGGPLARFV